MHIDLLVNIHNVYAPKPISVLYIHTMHVYVKTSWNFTYTKCLHTDTSTHHCILEMSTHNQFSVLYTQCMCMHKHFRVLYIHTMYAH